MPESEQYLKLQKRLAAGWNTWNTRSVLSHVLLPEGFALNLGIKDVFSGRHLRDALIGRSDQRPERVTPHSRTHGGNYTDLELEWQQTRVRIQTAAAGDELVILVTPLHEANVRSYLTVEAGMLWNRPGVLILTDGTLDAGLPTKQVVVFSTVPGHDIPLDTLSPYLALPLDGPVGIATDTPRPLEEIRQIVDAAAAETAAELAQYGELADAYDAMRTVLAWDTIYSPERDRVITPVSRLWNCSWGGYVLFDWDTYFAAYMLSLDSRDLAYANAIEITSEVEQCGFVPNFAAADNLRSRDRSQPPVGSLICRELYRRFGDRWFLDTVFENLLRWNRWWPRHRDADGYLCWGSNPYKPAGRNMEGDDVNAWQGAAYESGLDNSPMYDDVPFDKDASIMQLADVGLMSMYVADCDALADIADVLECTVESRELRDRADAYRKTLTGMWSDADGIFLNRRTDNGKAQKRLSPTNFYPLLARAPSQVQAERMMKDHLLNPDSFWGEWVLPSIARNDPAYADQEYWRGRIWAPMNFLVYAGMRNYTLPDACAQLSRKSVALLRQEWLQHGHIHENYHGDTGEGCDNPHSDAFYHWGALLGMIALIQAGEVDGPEHPLE